MKNLNEMGVQEMNMRELKETDGGGIVLAVCILVALLLISKRAH